MKKIILSTLAILTSIPLFAQNNIKSVLSSIDENNTTLKSLRERVEAQKLENKTDIYLPNPEVGFNYLWGNPAGIGNRTDFSVSQTFDIPTITGMKSRVASSKNNLAEWQYKSDRMAILLEAKQYCIELIYYNALMKELNLRLQHAGTIESGYRERLDRGDASILEYNKATLNLSATQGEISRIKVERKALLSHLKRLNGEVNVSLDDTQYSPVELALNFDDWYIQAEQKNPVLAYVKQEVEVNKKQVTLNKAMGLPSFYAGYMSEKVVGEHYQGISVGVSIPLWENKNRIRHAKSAVKAAESREADSKQQFYGQLKILYDRTAGMKATADVYRKSLETANSTGLLIKALDAGEISLLDYIMEIGLYYDTINRALEAERDFQKTYSELSAVEL